MHLRDLKVDIVKNSAVAIDTKSNALATATHAAVPGRHWCVVSVDASYSTSTVTAEVTVYFGTTIIARKYITGAGRIEFGDFGHQNPDANEAISAQLPAGGVGVTGDIMVCAFHTGPNA